MLFSKEFIYGFSTESAKLYSLPFICSFRGVQFSLDKYIMALNLFLGTYQILLFPHSVYIYKFLRHDSRNKVKHS